MISVRTTARVAALLGSVIGLWYASSCAESTAPGGSKQAGIRILAGAGISDTVDAVPTQAFVVEVKDTLGVLASGQVIRFAEVQSGGGELSVSPLAGAGFASSVAETTNAQGQAGVLIQLGPAAGVARLAVSVPVYGFADTASFTVLPGAPARVLVEPLDTTISIGAQFQLTAQVVDRHSNPRTGAVTYTALDTVVKVGTSGIVTAQATGVGRVVTAAGAVAAETCTVAVLPAGAIAASVPGGVLFVNLDGTGAATVTVPTADYNGRFPTWLSGTTVSGMDGQYYARLITVSTVGTVQYPIPTTDTTVVFEVWPQAARDGSWIFFGGLVPGYSTSGVSVWRIKPNGDSLTRVSPPNADGVSDTYPSPSPDGKTVAVATTRFGGFSLALINVATSQLTNLGIAGIAPRWAPAGDTIAYLGGLMQSEIWVVNANGTGARRVSPTGRSYAPGMDWSPDRKWIIARGGGGLELISVATGVVLPVTSVTADAIQPAWKP